MTGKTRSAPLLARVIGTVGGIAGFVLWLWIWNDVSSAVSARALGKLGDNVGFDALVVASGLGFILIPGIGFQWISEYFLGLSRGKS